jgi:hypothetical protein
MLQLLDSPWCEHNPGEGGVDEKDEGVGDSSSDTVATFSASTAYCRAGRSTATTRGESEHSTHTGYRQ